MATDGILLWRSLFEIADKVCRKYGLKYGKIEPETRKLSHMYGECIPCDRCCNTEHVNRGNCSHKIIKIRIHQLHRRNKPLHLRTIMDTLAHELAHLSPDTWEHGRAHIAFKNEILAYIRELGYSW